MTGSQLARATNAAAAANREAPDAKSQVYDLIQKKLPAMQAILPEIITAEKMVGLVMNEIRLQPKLAQCSADSLVGCVMRAAALGLMPGSDLGLCHFEARQSRERGMECTFNIDYPGIYELAMRSGKILVIEMRTVYRLDDFDYDYGLNKRLHHKPGPGTPENRGEQAVTHSYCIVRYANGAHDFEVLTKADIDARRARGNGPAWRTDYAKMAEKSALKAMRRRLPQSPDLAVALAQDGAAITVSTRGPAALTADHGDAPAIEPPREQETGEVDNDDTRAAEAALRTLEPAVAMAVVVKTTNGRTSDPGQLTDADGHNLRIHLRTAATDPAGLVREMHGKLAEDTDEARVLEGWLRDREAAAS